jgi:hypothetical protein
MLVRIESRTLLSSCLLSKTVKIRVYKAVILPVVLYGCEAWFLALRDEHRLSVFESGVLRRIFGGNNEVTGGQENCIMRSSIICNLRQVIRMIKSSRMRWVGHIARMWRRGTHMRY